MMPPDGMLAVDEALRIVLAAARALDPIGVRLRDASGLVLAETIAAHEDLPPFAAATMDGYAVVATDGPGWRRIRGEQLAGYVAGVAVSSGSVARITTGAPVPPGADAVVMVEATREVDGGVEITQPTIHVGENIRPIGADLQRGQPLLEAGAELGPAEIGLLASLGHADLLVHPRPRVAIISTGDELVEPWEEPGPGQIRDSNRYALGSAVERNGNDVELMAIATDVERPLRAALVDALARADVVITSGGVSMGQRDLVKVLLSELADVRFGRVFMKPGKPLHFAVAPGDTLVFGLPGNPVSALVGFEVFIRPALRRMAGHRDPLRPHVPVTLTHEVRPSDRLEFQRARVRIGQAGELLATTTGGQASSRLASMVGANAFLLIPPREGRYRAGESVEAMLVGELLPAR